MSIMHFAGATSASGGGGPPPVGVVALTADTASDFGLVGFGTAFASMSFGTTGARIRTETLNAVSVNVAGQWWSIWPVTDIGSSYQIRATLVSGTAPTGPTLGSTTWHDLSTLQVWSHTRSVAGTSGGVIEVSIRDIATSTIQATASYTIEAVMEN